ncbi:MAG: hypothetical protein MR927_04760 [Campylobacter sp.]|nr:hypothetical protein [Campylobacter sp.]
MLLFADCPAGWRLERFLEFARILVIAREQSNRSNLGILEFLGFLLPLLRSLEDSTTLEFLGQNLEFLEIASAFSKPRNDEILEFASFYRRYRKV